MKNAKSIEDIQLEEEDMKKKEAHEIMTQIEYNHSQIHNLASIQKLYS